MSNPYQSHSGRFTSTPDATPIQQACAKARLAKILAAEIDAAGNWKVSPEDQAWAIRVTIQRPLWAVDTLRAAGIK